MIAMNRRAKIFISKEPADMRASYDSLFSKVKHILDEDPMSGHLYVFINSRRNCCKCLYYDGTGLVIVSKRLERSLFCKINPYHPAKITLTQAEFNLFFEGSDLNKRFIESPVQINRAS